jgi:hypothetical protein
MILRRLPMQYRACAHKLNLSLMQTECVSQVYWLSPMLVGSSLDSNFLVLFKIFSFFSHQFRWTICRDAIASTRMVLSAMIDTVFAVAAALESSSFSVLRTPTEIPTLEPSITGQVVKDVSDALLPHINAFSPLIQSLKYPFLQCRFFLCVFLLFS